MRKLVNGQIVDVKNIELFEKAAEGVIAGKLAASTLKDKITVESSIINECIGHYEIFYKAMPFPLYAIENNLKYSALATFIKDCMETPLNMWVDEALFISIDKENNRALKIVGNSWGIVTTDCEKDDNTSIENFKDEVGYKEYEWLLSRIMNRQGTGSFYAQFMSDFVRACGNQPMIMKWELTNILTFGNIPDKIDFKENKIINLDNKTEYTLDIFSAGLRKSGESEYVLDLFGTNSNIKLKPKMVKTYGYNAYEKPNSDEDSTPDKLQKSEMIGLKNLFNTLCAIKMAGEKPEFDDFIGFVAERDLVYSVNGRIFTCKAYRQTETKEIARSVELYGFDRGMIYFIKPYNMGRGIRKEMIYSYSLKDDNLRLCKIQFVD